VVTDAWKGALDGHSTSIHAALKVVAGGLLVRTKNVLGDLEKTRKKLRKELEICRRRGINGENIAREEILRYRLEKVEKKSTFIGDSVPMLDGWRREIVTHLFSMRHAQRGGEVIELES
jgi:hypothetical protein